MVHLVGGSVGGGVTTSCGHRAIVAQRRAAFVVGMVDVGVHASSALRNIGVAPHASSTYRQRRAVGLVRAARRARQRRRRSAAHRRPPAAVLPVPSVHRRVHVGAVREQRRHVRRAAVPRRVDQRVSPSRKKRRGARSRANISEIAAMVDDVDASSARRHPPPLHRQVAAAADEKLALAASILARSPTSFPLRERFVLDWLCGALRAKSGTRRRRAPTRGTGGSSTRCCRPSTARCARRSASRRGSSCSRRRRRSRRTPRRSSHPSSSASSRRCSATTPSASGRAPT